MDNFIESLNKMIKLAEPTILKFMKRMEPLSELYKLNSNKDEMLTIDEKYLTLQHTFDLIDDKYGTVTGLLLTEGILVNSLHYTDGQDKKEFIDLLESMDKNHIKEDSTKKLYYSFIYQLLAHEIEVKKLMEEYKKDQRDYRRLKGRYPMLESSDELENVLKFYKGVNIGQVKRLLFELYTHGLDLNKEQAISLFSILYFKKLKQYTFFKDNDPIVKTLEEFSLDELNQIIDIKSLFLFP